MHDLKMYLLEKYGKPTHEISKSEFGNILIDKELKMISWDDAANEFHETNSEFKEMFSTADGLIIIEKEDKNQLFFFEFKNLDYSNEKDKQMAKYHLNKYLKQTKECSHDCEVYDDLKKISEYLIDISSRSLRSKPSDSLSLFFHIMKEYYEIENDKDACNKLFNTDKFFFLVSNTESQYNPYKNKSNRQNTIIKPLDFLKRFEPYHYDAVFAVNESGFDRYFYNRNKELLKKYN